MGRTFDVMRIFEELFLFRQFMERTILYLRTAFDFLSVTFQNFNEFHRKKKKRHWIRLSPKFDRSLLVKRDPDAHLAPSSKILIRRGSNSPWAHQDGSILHGKIYISTHIYENFHMKHSQLNQL